MSSTETGELHTLAIESAHIDWTVPDLSQQLEKLEVGEALMSPSFTASPEGRLRWYLKLKFNSSRAKRDGLVGLFLAREPIERKVDVKVEFRAAVVDAKGRKSEERNFLKNFTNEAPNDWGWHHYLQIGAAALVGPDTVKFRVQLELDSHKVTGDYYSVAPDTSEFLLQYLKELYGETQYADVTLVTQDQKFAAHKVILARCDYFRQKLEKKPGRHKLAVKEFKSEVLGEILHFIYSGRCENLEKLVTDVYEVAVKIGQSDLQDYCAAYMKSHLNANSAVPIYALALRNNLDELKLMAVQFISSNVEPSIADPILKLDRHDGEEIFVNKNKFVAEVKEKKKKFLMR